MKIKKFVEKAIEGGWSDDLPFKNIVCSTVTFGDFDKYGTERTIDLYKILLDPKAWQAVGKVEGWGNKGKHTCDQCSSTLYNKYEAHWEEKMYGMMDALVDGKSITEYLKTL